MKILLSLLFLFLSFSYLKAQDLYSILVASYKYVNVYNYNSQTDLQEKTNISIKNNKIQKRRFKIISEVLFESGFRIDNLNDTLLIATSSFDWVVGGPPTSIFAKSSQSIKLFKYDSYEDVTYKEMGPLRDYPENYPIIAYQGSADAFRGFYTSTVMDLSYYPENYYALMYHGDIEGFREFYVSKMGTVSGVRYSVLRVVIKDGKIVYPSIIWNY